MDRLAFIDTNVFLRHFLADHAEQTPRATAYLLQIERGERRAATSETVVFETVFVLDRRQRLEPAAVRNLVAPMISLPGLLLPGKERVLRALDVYAALNIPFADAYHAVSALAITNGRVVSFDHHYNRVPGVTRIEP